MRQKLTHLAVGLLGLGGLGPQALAAPPVPTAKTLAEPAREQTLETVDRGIAAIGVSSEAAGKGRLLLLSRGRRQLLVASFDPAGKTREAAFGKLLDQERVDLPKADDLSPEYWAGVVETRERVLVLEGRSLTFLELESKELTPVLQRSVPFDLVKPPRDRGGEPTAPETAAMRARFKKAALGTLGTKVTGLAALPDSWHHGAGRAYLLATRIKGFPLLLMECDRESPSSCLVARQCYLEGAGDLAADAVQGIGVSEARKLVVIGDRARRSLLTFRWDSCFHVPRVGTLELPAHPKGLTSVAVGGDDRLWIAAGAPDDYSNASVFSWPKEAW